MGIDYGRGQQNIDEHGIRYGIISANNLQSWVWDMDWQQEEFIACPHCGEELSEDFDPAEQDCPGCEKVITEGEQYQVDGESPLMLQGDEALQVFVMPDGDIWFFESPYKVKAGFCSPCAPGAVYLMSGDQDAVGYAPPPDWLGRDIKLDYVK